jgi:hypothetical protein
MANLSNALRVWLLKNSATAWCVSGAMTAVPVV